MGAALADLRRRFDEVVMPHLLPDAVKRQEVRKALRPVAPGVHDAIAPHRLDIARVPMRVDRKFLNPALHSTRPQAVHPAMVPPSLQAKVGLQGRAHLAVYEDTGRFMRLAGYRRSPFAVVSGQHRNLLARVIQSRMAADLNFNLTDEAATARTNNVKATGAGTTQMMLSLTTSNDQTKFKYGSGVTAPTENDTNIQTALGADITAAGLSYDDTAHTATMSGSRLHTEAGSTINEIACFTRFRSTAAVNYFALTDHTAISPGQALVTNQTVAISYVWQL
ncbi:MAG: hypothetical protein LC623_05700 [Halobacteriales archaeon]|nr:hypothetical protein [Halobacteriales archaeon]